MVIDSPNSGNNPEKVDFVAVATIGRPVGVIGWCRLFPIGNTLRNAVMPYRCFAGREAPDQAIVIKKMIPMGDVYFRCLFENVNTRDDVGKFVNCQLLISRQELPKTGPDEYYHFELEGMDVYGAETGKCFGKVRQIYNYPTVDALEVVNDGVAMLVPMTKEIMISIDRTGKRITVSEALLSGLV